jgi:hypothetical protein
MPSKVPDDGFQYGKLAKNPYSTTVYNSGNGVLATGRQPANYTPSLVLSEYTRSPTNKHTGKSGPGWMPEFSGSRLPCSPQLVGAQRAGWRRSFQ